MNRNIRSLAAFAFFVLAFSTYAALAQERQPVDHYSGLINDYSPSNVKGGPWEMHGQWTLDLQRWWGVADFTADMTMSDYGTTAGVLDATKGGQGAHTHHIKLTNAAVVWNMDGCPAFSPATTTGFQISGTVSLITGNGGPAPFEKMNPPESTLQVCVTGGSEVSYSNITLVFGGPATTHFGPQAVHGVVRSAPAD
jgi:hypothetical protein